VANVLVVLLLFFLGQDLHVCGISAERKETEVVVVLVEVEVEVEVSRGEERFGEIVILR
jgi:hypothetical protein